ncbi:hypothetical protein J2S00_003057 [Caldalkalibacillus uzonensis]|uniref:50S ribosomal protein L33 n=1 Tax=Caldalkalibacillus uzonensis TaxID=353224 RepID=A0ABU0CV12_9BACI|nr:hypothetical protein [Caldalkalibacillus uzonensis]MDQ0340252.1 hypothetical protein [Caldalkalibacillus uzonensis]
MAKGSLSITLQCAYCGSEEVKMTIGQLSRLKKDIRCKCGKWLVKDGKLGHKHTEERDKHGH